jgi:thioredoxin 1
MKNINEIINLPISVLVFSAEWCKPCKILKPIVEELSDELKDKIPIIKLDVDENSDIAAQLGVRNVPTILFFKNGEVVDKMVGANTKSNLESKINSLI